MWVKIFLVLCNFVIGEVLFVSISASFDIFSLFLKWWTVLRNGKTSELHLNHIKKNIYIEIWVSYSWTEFSCKKFISYNIYQFWLSIKCILESMIYSRYLLVKFIISLLYWQHVLAQYCAHGESWKFLTRRRTLSLFRHLFVYTSTYPLEFRESRSSVAVEYRIHGIKSVKARGALNFTIL